MIFATVWQSLPGTFQNVFKQQILQVYFFVAMYKELLKLGALITCKNLHQYSRRPMEIHVDSVHSHHGAQKQGL